MKDLVDRNLLIVHDLKSNGKLKTCKVHDLVRDLCRKMGEKERFFCVSRVFNFARDIDREGRIVICEGNSSNLEVHPLAFRSVGSTSLALSLALQGDSVFRSRLLRVLVESTDSLGTILQQVNLRFLAYECSIGARPWWNDTYKFDSSISLLWNVQTIIVKGTIDKIVAPVEIWRMPQLRHLEFYSIHLPDPPPTDEPDNHIALRNLHTLQIVLDFKCSDEVCKRLPNIRKLHISYDLKTERITISTYCLHNLGRLRKLESLKYHFSVPPNRDDLLKNISFPGSLKKLSLQGCMFDGNDLTMIGSLPHLEVLKLGNDSIKGPEWSPKEGEFLRLKFLKIFSCNLIRWNAEISHFPVLETLVVQRLHELDEIPLGIGEIATLRSISVGESSISAGISAIKVVEEQESYGNEGLQVRVRIWDERGCEEFKKLVELEGFTSHHFQIYSGPHQLTF